MRRIIAILFIGGALLLSGCEQKEAREYAQRLANALKSYKVEINKKIEAEQEAGKMQAAVYSYTQRTDALLSLENDRFRRASVLAESLIAGGKLTPVGIQGLLAEYAKLDFDTTRAIFEKDADDQAAFLTGIENLELQAQNIDALIGALEDLARPGSDIAQLKDAAAFAVKFKQKLDELRCEDLASEIKCLELKAAAATGVEKTRIQGEIDRLKQRMKNDQCADGLLASAVCKKQ
jgi:uncharacterized protein YicC (UPF0701 family)